MLPKTITTRPNLNPADLSLKLNFIKLSIKYRLMCTNLAGRRLIAFIADWPPLRIASFFVGQRVRIAEPFVVLLQLIGWWPSEPSDFFCCLRITRLDRRRAPFWFKRIGCPSCRFQVHSFQALNSNCKHLWLEFPVNALLLGVHSCKKPRHSMYPRSLTGERGFYTRLANNLAYEKVCPNVFTRSIL